MILPPRVWSVRKGFSWMTPKTDLCTNTKTNRKTKTFHISHNSLNFWSNVISNHFDETVVGRDVLKNGRTDDNQSTFKDFQTSNLSSNLKTKIKKIWQTHIQTSLKMRFLLLLFLTAQHLSHSSSQKKIFFNKNVFLCVSVCMGVF
jgi:hypothetical protein